MITDTNPFVYSRPVGPDELIDRDAETEELLRSAVGGHYVRLYAPRKFGKTSLLRRVLRDGERREGLIPILVDLYGVLSYADVTVRIERAYAKHLKGALRRAVEGILQRTGLGLSLGAYGISAKLQLDPRLDPVPALHSLLDLPLQLENFEAEGKGGSEAADLGTRRRSDDAEGGVKSGGFRALIAFDEFQDIANVAGMDALLRSHIQHQGEVASYVFAGSEPAMMKQLFEVKERPLYGQAVPVHLGRLSDSDIAPYVADRFEETGRNVGEAINPLLAAARGHPQRTMLLAHRLWEELEQGDAASLDDWHRAHTRALHELQPEFDAHWRRFTTVEQKTLRAVISGEGSPYRRQVLERLQLTKSSAQEGLRNLAAIAEVENVGGRYVVIDPLFSDWIDRLREEHLED